MWPSRQRESSTDLPARRVTVPKVDRREIFSPGPWYAVVNSPAMMRAVAGIAGQGDGGNLRFRKGLITRLGAFVFGAEVDPELGHLQRAAVAGEIARMEFLVDDAVAGGHPLDVARADFSTAAAGVAVLEFALVGDGDGLETFVRMSADTAFFIAGGKGMRRGVIEQEEGAQFAAEAVVIKHGADGEAVADPVSGGTLMDA